MDSSTSRGPEDAFEASSSISEVELPGNCYFFREGGVNAR